MAEIRSLTALRGVAALWIVLHHFWPQTSAATPYLIAKGYLAVDMFFILSGTVLFIVYADDFRAGRFSFSGFAWKRFARLYPIHLTTLILAVIILCAGPLLGLQARALPYDMSQMIALQLGLLHSWGLTESGGLNYPSWSISAEAFAYLLFPLMALTILRTRPLAMLIISIAFLGATACVFQVIWPQQLRPEAGALVLTRLENDFGALRIVPEFVLGLTLAHAVRSRVLNHKPVWFGLLVIAGGLAVDLDLLVVFGFAALIAGLLAADPKAPSLLHRLGVISYSLYMVHAIVQITGFKLIETAFGYPDGAVPPYCLIPLIGLTLFCAAILYRWVECPSRSVLLRLSARQVHAPATARSPSI